MKIHLFISVLLSFVIFVASPDSCIAQDSSKISADMKILAAAVLKRGKMGTVLDFVTLHNGV